MNWRIDKKKKNLNQWAEYQCSISGVPMEKISDYDNLRLMLKENNSCSEEQEEV